MRLVAINTIHAKKFTRKPDPAVANDHGSTEDVVVKPGSDFESSDLGMTDHEVQSLIAANAIKRKTREIPDEAASKKS